jgi:hypothetical protein
MTATNIIKPVRAGRQKKKPAEFSTLHCSAEWHFASFKSNYSALIYSHGSRLTHESKTYRVSIPTMARYFGVHPDTIRRAIHELRDNGWAEETYAPLGKAVEYRLIDHKEWAGGRDAWIAKNPGLAHVARKGKCCEKLEFASIGDPLGRSLYGITGLTYFGNQLKWYRKYGTDEQIVSHCRALWAEERDKDKEPKGFHRRLSKYIAERTVQS